MKRKPLAFVIAFLFLTEKSYSIKWDTNLDSTGYGSVAILDDSGSPSFVYDLDITEHAKALTVSKYSSWNSLDSHGSLSFLSKEEGVKKAFTLKTSYTFNNLLMVRSRKRFWLETSFAGAMVSGSYIQPWTGMSRFQFMQFPYGIFENLKFQWETRKSSFTLQAGGNGVMSLQSDDYGAWNTWDNYGMAIQSYYHSEFRDWLALNLGGDFSKTRYNEDKYFFTEDWTRELVWKSALVISPLARLDIIPQFNYKEVNVERDGRSDLARLEIGAALWLKHLDIKFSTASFFVKGVYAPWQHKEGSERLLAVGLVSKEVNIEAYQKSLHNQFSNFAIDDTVIGLNVSWKFGSKDEQALRNLDDYSYTPQREYQFYQNSGVKDNASLTLEQHGERLGTLRMRNEWSGANLKYKTADDYYFKDAYEVYMGRLGDCDEQSCHNIYLDTRNRYRAYNLGIYDWDQWKAHAVEIVQDPTNGQWFLDEYGMIFKTKVNPNASLAVVAKEALRQNANFTALPITRHGANMAYEIADCSVIGNYPFGDYWWIAGSLEGLEPQAGRPQTEYGYELFTRRNFLFGDKKH